MEAACGLGLADAVVDLVETGTTMRAAGLCILTKILDTQAVLITNPHTKHAQLAQQLCTRIQGYIDSTKYQLMQYNVPRVSLAAAVKITPGKKSPSILPLEREDWVAVSGGKGDDAGAALGSLALLRLMSLDDEPANANAATKATPAKGGGGGKGDEAGGGEGEGAVESAEAPAAAPSAEAAAPSAETVVDRRRKHPPPQLVAGQALYSAKGSQSGTLPSAAAAAAVVLLRDEGNAGAGTSDAADAAAVDVADAADEASSTNAPPPTASTTTSALPVALREPFAFGPEDLVSGAKAAAALSAGDTVAVQLVISDADGRVRPTRVRLVAAAVEERERGIVQVIKEGFGFLKCESRDGQLFFHLRDLCGGAGAPSATSLRAGDEFDFVVVMDERSKRPNAVKLRPIPKGSVKFETPLQPDTTGRVVSLNLAQGSGEVLLDSPWDGERCVGFMRHAVVSPRNGLPAVGTTVNFTLSRHKAKGHLCAVAVSAGEVAATVERLINSSKGILRLSEPLAPPPLAASDPSSEPAAASAAMPAAAPAASPTTEAAPDAPSAEPSADVDATPSAPEGAVAAVSVLGAAPGTLSTVVFYAADVAEKDVTLCTGDEVSCVLGANPKTGEVAGRQIRVTKEAPKAPERHQWVKKELKERTNIIHYAKGPDGTRGFAIGRGRPIDAGLFPRSDESSA